MADKRGSVLSKSGAVTGGSGGNGDDAGVARWDANAVEGAKAQRDKLEAERGEVEKRLQELHTAAGSVFKRGPAPIAVAASFTSVANEVEPPQHTNAIPRLPRPHTLHKLTHN